MKLLFYLFVFGYIVTQISCSKDSQKSVGTFDLLKKHVWVEDSGYNISNGDTTRLAIDLTNLIIIHFTDSTYVTNTNEYAASYEQPDKIYYWFYGQPQDKTLNFTIKSVNDNYLTLNSYYGSNVEYFEYFYHAR